MRLTIYMNELVKFFDRDDLRVGDSSGTELKIPFDLSPEDFIKFAEEDITSKNTKELVNALSNIKRAVHAQMDSLLFIFGFHNQSKQQSWNFPKKISILKEVGIIAPRILEKINNKRNLLEHDYKIPKPEEIEDFFDVVNLFIYYTRRFITKLLMSARVCTENNILEGIPITSEKSEWCACDWDPRNSKFSFVFHPKKGEPITFQPNPDDSDYIKFVKCYCKILHLD